MNTEPLRTSQALDKYRVKKRLVLEGDRITRTIRVVVEQPIKKKKTQQPMTAFKETRSHRLKRIEPIATKVAQNPIIQPPLNRILGNSLMIERIRSQKLEEEEKRDSEYEETDDQKFRVKPIKVEDDCHLTRYNGAADADKPKRTNLPHHSHSTSELLSKFRKSKRTIKLPKQYRNQSREPASFRLTNSGQNILKKSQTPKYAYSTTGLMTKARNEKSTTLYDAFKLKYIQNNLSKPPISKSHQVTKDVTRSPSNDNEHLISTTNQGQATQVANIQPNSQNIAITSKKPQQRFSMAMYQYSSEILNLSPKSPEIDEPVDEFSQAHSNNLLKISQMVKEVEKFDIQKVADTLRSDQKLNPKSMGHFKMVNKELYTKLNEWGFFDTSEVKKKSTVKQNKKRLARAIKKYLSKIHRLGLTLAEIATDKVFSKTPFDKPGLRDLIDATKEGNYKYSRELLENDKYLVYGYDDIGLTALHWAIIRDHRVLMLLMIKFGADIDQTDLVDSDY